MVQGRLPYIGRFAPSPTGPLHAGSLVAALASWLDAQAHGGHWLVRIEDVDTPRGVPGADHLILQQLHACGLQPDTPPVWQSQRSALYQQALVQLIEQNQAYACLCSRKAIAAALAALGQQRHRRGELVYPAPAETPVTPAQASPGGCAPRPARCTGKIGAWAHSSKTWVRRWATLC